MSGQPYNPKDRIKKHFKRKSSSRCLHFFETSPSSSFGLDGVETESCPAPQTSNPFKITSPLRKRRPQVTFPSSEENEENAQDSFDANVLKHKLDDSAVLQSIFPTTSGKLKTHFERFQSFDTSLVHDMHAIDFSQLMSQSTAQVQDRKDETEQSDGLPLDLRVGAKLRIVCGAPFPWMSSRKHTGIVAVRVPAIERYNGMKYFNELFSTGFENQCVTAPAADLSILEAATMYWQFPVVPGMALYPRITSELKQVHRVPLAPLAIKVMSDQWVECYEQLFMSYKKGERDGFYVASAVFNVLFTKTTICDDVDISEESQSCYRSFVGQQLVALVSHTTSSTREHLRTQGVDYEVIGPKTLKRVSSMPTLGQVNVLNAAELDLKEGSPVAVISEERTHEDYNSKRTYESSDENDSPTKANQEWLKDIGVSPRNVMKNRSRRYFMFSVPLLHQGSAVQSLYNTLMSSDVVHEKTGPYTKIPPTLFATSPFLYAQLLSLNKSSQVIQKINFKTTEYVLELDGGPVLPHCANLMVQFLRTTKMCEKTTTIQVSDRHSSNGMNDWTDRTTSWNTVHVLSDCVKWKKINS